MNNKKQKFTSAFDEAPKPMTKLPDPDQVYGAPKIVPTRQKAGDDLGHGATMSQTGLQMPTALNIDQWQAIGDRISQQADKLQWVIGDWMLYGERHWGLDDEDGKNITTVYDIAEAITGYSRRSLWRFKNVSEYFDGENFLRRKSVKYSIHANAYEGIPEEYRDAVINDLLAEAERDQWTNTKLRQELKDMKSPKQLVEGESKPSSLPGALDRFSSHVTRVQYKKLSREEQRSKLEATRELVAKMERWYDQD